MFFVSIIWNYFEDLPIEICKHLNIHSPIQRVTLLSPGSHFGKFIRDVYSCNKIKGEYVSNKILDLEGLPNKNVLIIVHEIFEPELCFDMDEKNYFSVKCRVLKEEIRNKFNNEFNCIDKAPIIHSTDNEIETLELIRIVQQYYRICYSRIIESNNWNIT